MSKKHFEALAQALRDTRPSQTSSQAAWLYWEKCVNSIADVCEDMNENFYRERFLAATRS